MLVNHSYSVIDRVRRRIDGYLLAIKQDLTLIWMDNAHFGTGKPSIFPVPLGFSTSSMSPKSFGMLLTVFIDKVL